jgi:hypothetical protein
MSIKLLKDQLKKLREEHSGKPLARMTEDELKNEVEHHEVGCKTRALKKSRLDALAKAREVRAAPKKEKEVEVKVPLLKKDKPELSALEKEVVAKIKKGLISVD